MMAAPMLPATLPPVTALPGDVRNALPALTVMVANGAVNFLIAILILIAGWVVARGFARWLRGLLSHNSHVDDTLKPLIINFARYSVIGLTLVAVLGQFGVQTTSLIALLGATGLAIGLALQGTLANVASGVMLLFLRPFRVNENITSGSATGKVEEIGLFQTILVTDDGLFTAVPNSSLFTGVIVNNSRQPTHRMNVTIDVDYRADLPLAIATMKALLARDARLLAEPAPVVQVASLSGAAANIQVLAWALTGDAAGMQADFLAHVRAALLEKGIGPAQPLAPVSPDPSVPAASAQRP